MSTLPQDLSTAHKLIQDLQGKLKAMERENAQIKREAEKTAKEADAVRADADQTIAQAADQLGQANAICMGIYALGTWASAHIENAIAAMHVVHREGTLVSVLEEFSKAAQAGDKNALAQAKAKADPIVKTHRSNTELIRVEIEKTCQLQFRDRAREAMDKLLGLL